MKRQISINGFQHNATIHYISKYGYVPLWVLVKVLSFGVISDLYSILKPDDKVGIASIYNISIENLESFLPILSNYRNLCAHEDILYDHKTDRSIANTSYHQRLNIARMDNEYIYGKNDLFSVIIIFKILLNKKAFIMKYLLTDEEFLDMMREIQYEIELLAGKMHSININKILDRIGFPINYMELTNL